MTLKFEDIGVIKVKNFQRKFSASYMSTSDSLHCLCTNKFQHVVLIITVEVAELAEVFWLESATEDGGDVVAGRPGERGNKATDWGGVAH